MKLFLYLFLFATSSCICKREIGVGGNIKVSKRKKVFLGELNIKNEIIYINDSIKLSIKEVWMERKWSHQCNFNILRQNESIGYNYQLCILSNLESLRGYGENWEIGYNSIDKFYVISDSLLVMDFQNTYLESVCMNTYKNLIYDDDSRNQIIGSFCLIEKNKTIELPTNNQ